MQAMKKPSIVSFVSALALSVGWASLSAQGALAPAEIKGAAVYVPYPVAIAIDGKLDDWKGIPLQTVERGPMTSKDPAKNGAFSFAVAADEANFYILMLAKDKSILAGTHGTDTWNEDSMEFYLNLSGRLGVRKYLRDVVQYRITPTDVGNEDLSKLNVSGSNAALYPLKAKVFKTEDGWGFEGAVQLPPKMAPAHGREIGFQAQLNGASEKDRDVKLIWSLADASDDSWENPSLFGRALFFKVGSADVPKPSEVAAEPIKPKPPAPAAPVVAIDQVGYFPEGRKLASIASIGSEPLPWTLVDASSGKEVASGKTEALPYDLLSGDSPQVADFSSFKKGGTYYVVLGDRRSPDFRIGADVLSGLALDSLKYFYRSRSGIGLKKEFAGATWTRDAGHLTDAKVAVFGGTDAQGKAWEGYDFLVDGSGGWYDAGDFGKYVVNGGISVWTLQDAYERHPAAFKDGQLGIPESGNGKPDILEEARWELDFMLRMQIPEGNKLAGMCFHKLHDRKWAPMPCALPTAVDNNVTGKDGWSWGRFAYEPTTAATLNLAACAAQASRLWASMDPAFSGRCLAAAKAAWKAASEHPSLFAGNVPGDGGGNYDDGDVSDEFFWAAAELFATTGDGEYLQFLKASPYWKNFPGLDGRRASAMNWSDTAALGSLTLLSAASKLEKADRASLESQVVATADRYLDEVAKGGYGVPMESSGYVWGSNSGVLNNAIILAVAYDATKKPAYRAAVTGAMDYLLGYNALRRSFVTGYGAFPVLHPHHRLWANDPEGGYVAPPPGVVAGGPNKNIQDPEMKSANLASAPIAKRYLDVLGSFATNEVAINWNASLAWVANWLIIQYGGN
jgi:endoglucanase